MKTIHCLGRAKCEDLHLHAWNLKSSCALDAILLTKLDEEMASIAVRIRIFWIYSLSKVHICGVSRYRNRSAQYESHRSAWKEYILNFTLSGWFHNVDICDAIYTVIIHRALLSEMMLQRKEKKRKGLRDVGERDGREFMKFKLLR